MRLGMIKAWIRTLHRWWRHDDGAAAHDQSGAMGLTDVLLGVAVAAIALPTVIAATNRHTEEVQDQVAAQQLKAVSEAAKAFIRNNFRTIYTDIGTPGALNFLTIADLRNGGYLPASFSNINAFEQDQVVLLRRVAENTGTCATLPATGDCAELIEAVVVTTGGTIIDPARAGRIATMAGQNGGTIVDTGTARGAYGGWCADLSLFSAAGGLTTTCATTDSRAHQSNALDTITVAAPDTGGLAAAMFFNGNDITSDFLARVDTGYPEDNRMRTSLLMGENDIKDLGSVTFNDTVGRGTDSATLSPVSLTYDHAALLDDLQQGPGTTCEAGQIIARTPGDDGWECISPTVTSVQMLDSEAEVDKPACAGGTPVIYTSVASFADSLSGNLAAAVQTWATNVGGTERWAIHMRVRVEESADQSDGTVDGWVTPPPNIGKILVITGCSSA